MKELFNPRKPVLWIIIAVLVAAVVAAVCLLAKPSKTEVSSELDACIVDTIRVVHHSDHTNGKHPTVTYTVLDIKEKKDTVTVYGVMLYREYTCTTRNELNIWGAAHSAFALTAEKTDDGYEAVECWWPEDGANYVSSIKKKFPARHQATARNAQRFYATHDAASQAAAQEYYAEHPEELYTVYLSERENVWLAYQQEGAASFLIASGGFSADGTFLFTGNMSAEFIFADRTAVFDIDGNDFIYNAKASHNIPEEWTTMRDTLYLADGTRFRPVVRSDTAPVGLTVTVDGGMTWMDEEGIRKMFGYVPNNSDATDSAERPYYLPVTVLNTRAQLDQLLSEHREDSRWRDLKQETFTQYDEAFFEKNSLVMTYYKAGTYMAQPSVASYVFTEDYTCLSVRLDVHIPDAHDTALGQWLLFSGIKKTDLEGISVLEAYVQTDVSDDDLVLGKNALTFTGKVKQVDGDAVLMECYDATRFSGGVWVELGGTALDPQVGEEYVITYEDMVMLSLPPRITAVHITPVSSTPPASSEEQLLDEICRLNVGEKKEYVTLTGLVTRVEEINATRFDATFDLQVQGKTIYCNRVWPADGFPLDIAVNDVLTLRGTVRNNEGTIEFCQLSTYCSPGYLDGDLSTPPYSEPLYDALVSNLLKALPWTEASIASVHPELSRVYCEDGVGPDIIGYGLKDLDNNGQAELILAYTGAGEGRPLDVFTIKDGRLMHLFNLDKFIDVEYKNAHLYLHEDGFIKVYCEYKTGKTARDYYRLQDGELISAKQEDCGEKTVPIDYTVLRPEIVP